jgi:hypothetical protein
MVGTWLKQAKKKARQIEATCVKKKETGILTFLSFAIAFCITIPKFLEIEESKMLPKGLKTGNVKARNFKISQNLMKSSINFVKYRQI